MRVVPAQDELPLSTRLGPQIRLEETSAADLEGNDKPEGSLLWLDAVAAGAIGSSARRGRIVTAMAMPTGGPICIE